MPFTFYDREIGDVMSLKFYGLETGDIMSLQFLVLVFLYRGRKDFNKEKHHCLAPVF